MSNQGNGGLYSKFQQRLRNIRIARSKRKKLLKDNDKFIQERLDEIRKVVGKETVIVTSPIRGIPENKKESSKENISNNIKINVEENIEKKDVSFQEDKNEISVKIKEIREKKPNLSPYRKGYSYQREFIKRSDFRNYSDDEKRKQLDIYGVKIISKIKGNFEDHLDELDVLMSELYFLDKDQKNILELKKVKETKKEIIQLIEKINTIIEQYNAYKENYYIDNVIGIDDNQIVDDMISYRALLDDVFLEKDFVRGYKALNEFKDLYQNLDKIKTKVIALRDENEEKIEEFDIRDKKYDQIKIDIVKVDDVLKNCDEEMERQNKYFDDLMSKIDNVDRIEYNTYHLRGVQELLGQSLRYLGFLMLSPLSGLLPGITLQTIATKKLVGNAYKKIRMEEVKHVRYETINYDSELNHKLTDIDYTAGMIDETLKDIEKLKDTFMLQYDSRIPGYEDTLKKIDKIHHNVVRSQNKVDKIKERLKVSKKINEKKMVRVRRLNGY